MTKTASKQWPPKQLILKCYAEQDDNCWVAVCINFNLAAEGDSFEEVKTKLESMITDYVYDALAGEDKAYAAQLLSRSAPLSGWVKFHSIRLKIALWQTYQRIFTKPCHYARHESGDYSPLTCKDVKKILAYLGFVAQPSKGTSHEQWVKMENGRLYKVTVDCPQSAVFANIDQKHGRTSRTEKERFLPHLSTALRARH